MFHDLLDEVLEAWTGVRRGVVAEVENIPADRFDFRPTEEVRSVSELVRHIMEVSCMMVGELVRQETDLTRAPVPELLEEHAGWLDEVEGKEELLAALEETLADGTERLHGAGELHMLAPMRRFDGEWGTRMAWLNHGISQEMYHRGQLCTYQRLMGRVPALTRRIRGED